MLRRNLLSFGTLLAADGLVSALPGVSEATDAVVPPSPASKAWVERHGIRTLSGLPWLSGITPTAGAGAVDMLDEAEKLRGCRCDSMVLFQGGANRKSWNGFVRCYQPGHGFQIGEDAGKVVARGMVPILTIPGIIRGANYADAVAGEYDDFHRRAAEAMAQTIAANGKPPLVILRPSRESDDQKQPFAAERDIRNFMKFHAENFTRIWTEGLAPTGAKMLTTFCLTKRGSRGLKAWDWGADIVDCDLYINSPSLTKREDAEAYERLFAPFYDHATKTSRPLAFSEWGVRVKKGGDGDGAPGSGRDFSANDCAAGIEWMRSLFARLAEEGVLVHENCYSAAGHGIVLPTIDAPRASEAYRRWARGA
jgi:hypothetical protein